MVNAGTVNAYSRCAFPRQNARFSAISPENLHFKNPVKYNVKAGINDKCAKTATAMEPWLLK
jgi:hypothetical protein